jgi:hypothetical protein
MKKYASIKYFSYLNLVAAIFFIISSEKIDWRLSTLATSLFFYILYNELNNKKN